MASSRAATVDQYLAELPPERRRVVAAIRDVVNHHLPKGYAEEMVYGMLGWVVPLSRYPETYNGQPLTYLALAAQKGNYAFYSMCAYADAATTAWIRDEYRRAGLRLDMGKSCIRFKDLGGLPMSVVERLSSLLTVDRYIAEHERSRAGASRPKRAAAAKPAKAAAKPARKKAATKAPARGAKPKPARGAKTAAKKK